MIITLLKKYWITISLSALILVLCFMNTAELPEAPMTNFDKLVHLLMFMGLSGVVFFDNTNYLRKPVSRQRIFWSSFLFPVLFSGFIEIMQEYFTTNRTGDWMDFLFDSIGATIGLIVCLLINRRLVLR
ncbi:membrane protein [Bacteroidia bacterium]|nr:membrane protein [Bacteroidia bacterium]GHT52678.1 membrane protein [Bacteroidia bacterium]